MLKKKVQSQKPIEHDIHLKYKCPTCDQHHWLAFREAKTKNFKVVCDCNTVFKVKRISAFKIKYQLENKSFETEKTKNEVAPPIVVPPVVAPIVVPPVVAPIVVPPVVAPIVVPPVVAPIVVPPVVAPIVVPPVVAPTIVAPPVVAPIVVPPVVAPIVVPPVVAPIVAPPQIPLELLNKACKLFITYGFTQKESILLLKSSYEKNPIDDYSALIKNTLELIKRK
jgi:hypothetical protein